MDCYTTRTMFIFQNIINISKTYENKQRNVHCFCITQFTRWWYAKILTTTQGFFTFKNNTKSSVLHSQNNEKSSFKHIIFASLNIEKQCNLHCFCITKQIIVDEKQWFDRRWHAMLMLAKLSSKILELNF